MEVFQQYDLVDELGVVESTILSGSFVDDMRASQYKDKYLEQIVDPITSKLMQIEGRKFVKTMS
jgi:hypothetical protein